MMSTCQEFQVIFKKSKNEVSHYYEFESNLFWLKCLVQSQLHEEKSSLRTQLHIFISTCSERMNHSDSMAVIYLHLYHSTFFSELPFIESLITWEKNFTKVQLIFYLLNAQVLHRNPYSVTLVNIISKFLPPPTPFFLWGGSFLSFVCI